MSNLTNEWLFRYRLIVASDVDSDQSRAIADDLVHDVAVKWAEEHGYGIGGVVHKKENWTTPSPELYWILWFGLLPIRSDQYVPKEAADELLSVLLAKAREFGAELDG